MFCPLWFLVFFFFSYVGFCLLFSTFVSLVFFRGFSRVVLRFSEAFRLFLQSLLFSIGLDFASRKQRY